MQYVDVLTSISGTLVLFVVLLKSLGSAVAFNAMVSIATVGLFIAYALPIFFRLTIGRRTFKPGPFNLGPFSLIVGWTAVAWVGFISVLFCLPVTYPVQRDTLNYAPIAVGGVFIVASGYWLISARYWFRGPQPNLKPMTLANEP